LGLDGRDSGGAERLRDRGEDLRLLVGFVIKFNRINYTNCLSVPCSLFPVP
jgi:hypothetical protein